MYGRGRYSLSDTLLSCVISSRLRSVTVTLMLPHRMGPSNTTTLTWIEVLCQVFIAKKSVCPGKISMTVVNVWNVSVLF